MKKLLLLTLLLCGTAHANMIEFTPPRPGGPSNWGPYKFFDEARQGYATLPPPEGLTYFDGWVSRYGAVDGGTNFFTDMFNLEAPQTAQVWWDLRSTTLAMEFVTVWGRDSQGSRQEKTYQAIGWTERFTDPLMIGLDDGFVIESVAFYGLLKVPEPGSLSLLAISLGGLGWLGRRRR